MGAKRTAGVVAGVVVVGAVAAAITVFNLPEKEDNADPGSTAPAATADIAKTTLVDRESHDGTLGHGDTITISARGSGTVTGLPPQGSTVKRGAALYRIDNKPVILLYGTLPAYRTLSSGTTGSDVKLFEQNLWALGYRGFTVDRTYSASTASAVRKWQKAAGITRTGTVETNQIVYAAGEVRVDSWSTEVGALVGGGTELEKITGIVPLATVSLEMSSARLAKQNAGVKVTLPDGKIVDGKISKLETVLSKGEDGEADTTKISVVISFTKAVTSSGTAAVSVAFTAGQRPNVLAVPVAALVALAEGGYGVQVVDGTTTRIVAVQTGLFADGQVEIKGNGLQAGNKVVMPS